MLVPAGTTPAPGSLAGKIAVVDVPITVVPLSFFTRAAYPGATYDPHHLENPSALYNRPYLNGMVPLLDALDTAGAAGVIAVLDFPSAAADGSYFPYDGIIRKTPGVYVDRSNAIEDNGPERSWRLASTSRGCLDGRCHGRS